MHKTANVIAKLPKSQQPKVKCALQEIWMAETKAAAELAFDAFIESYMPKYEKAANCRARIGTHYFRSTTSRPSTGNNRGHQFH